MECERESGGSLEWGFEERHDFCFFVVNAHSTSLCPILASIYHGSESCRGSCHKYHVINEEEGSNLNSVEVVNWSDFKDFDEWEFGFQFL